MFKKKCRSHTYQQRLFGLGSLEIILATKKNLITSRRLKRLRSRLHRQYRFSTCIFFYLILPNNFLFFYHHNHHHHHEMGNVSLLCLYPSNVCKNHHQHHHPLSFVNIIRIKSARNFFFFYCNLCVMVLGIVANVRFTFVLQYRQVVCVNLSSYKYNTATGYDEKKARQKKFFSVCSSCYCTF